MQHTICIDTLYKSHWKCKHELNLYQVHNSWGHELDNGHTYKANILT